MLAELKVRDVQDLGPFIEKLRKELEEAKEKEKQRKLASQVERSEFQEDSDDE